MSFFKELGPQDGNAPKSFSMDNPIEPIPDNTDVLAFIEEATIDPGNAEWDQEEHVKLKWKVLKPDEYKNRVLYHNVKVFESDQAKRVRQLKMLQAIDGLTGGHISNNGLTEAALQQLQNKPMLIKLKVWEMNGKTGNWVCAVSEKPTGVEVEIPEAQSFNDDDIPF